MATGDPTATIPQFGRPSWRRPHQERAGHRKGKTLARPQPGPPRLHSAPPRVPSTAPRQPGECPSRPQKQVADKANIQQAPSWGPVVGSNTKLARMLREPGRRSKAGWTALSSDRGGEVGLYAARPAAGPPPIQRSGKRKLRPRSRISEAPVALWPKPELLALCPEPSLPPGTLQEDQGKAAVTPSPLGMN